MMRKNGGRETLTMSYMRPDESGVMKKHTLRVTDHPFTIGQLQFLLKSYVDSDERFRSQTKGFVTVATKMRAIIADDSKDPATRLKEVDGMLAETFGAPAPSITIEIQP